MESNEEVWVRARVIVPETTRGNVRVWITTAEGADRSVSVNPADVKRAEEVESR